MIFNQLYKDGSIHFNEMLKIINKNRQPNARQVTKTTLSKHLEKMVKQSILDKDETEKGYKGSYRLTETAKTLKKIGLFENIKTKREEEYDFDESKDIYKLFKKLFVKILLSKILGRHKLIKTQKANPGDISINGKSYEVLSEPGFSLHDEVEATNIHFSKTITEDILKGNIIENMNYNLDEIQNPTSEYSDYERHIMNPYNIHLREKTMLEYFSICAEILAYVIVRMELAWYIRRYKPQEIRWYNDVMGREGTLNFFEYQLKQPRKTELNVKGIKNRVKEWDSLIDTRTKELDSLVNQIDKPLLNESSESQRWASGAKARGIIRKIVLDFTYPIFMRNLISDKKI